MIERFAESVVEDAVLAWLKSMGYAVASGLSIAPGRPDAEREDYSQVVVTRRVYEAFAQLNPTLPVEVLDDAFRKLTHSEGTMLKVRKLAVHQGVFST